MSTALTPSDNAEATATVVNAPTEEVQLVRVRVSSLITGRALRFPIYDQEGLLLLAEGQVITSKFKELLTSRNIEEIQVNPDEVANIALIATAAQQPKTALLDNEITKKLDAIIESGALFVSNIGPAVRDSIQKHGCKAYDPAERQKIIDQHKQISEDLNDMMQDALHGRPLDGNKLLRATAMYLGSMTADIENVLTAAQAIGRDATLSQHCIQTSLLAMAIGIEMQLDVENTRTLGLCGLVHDWGMIRIPEAIRNAPRRLTAAEFMEIKKHPMYVLDFLERAVEIPAIVPLVCYQIHERPNGTGYPRERQKGAIHSFARILSVADQYVALTSPRPYRAPLMPYAAMECLLRQAKVRAVDANVVRALLQVNSLFPIGSFVALNDASVARVLRRSGTSYATPIVQLLQRADGEPFKDDGPIIDLCNNSLHVVQALPTPGSDEIGLTEDVLNMST